MVKSRATLPVLPGCLWVRAERATLVLGSENGNCHLLSMCHINPHFHGLNTSKEMRRARLVRRGKGLRAGLCFARRPQGLRSRKSLWIRLVRLQGRALSLCYQLSQEDKQVHLGLREAHTGLRIGSAPDAVMGGSPFAPLCKDSLPLLLPAAHVAATWPCWPCVSMASVPR